MTYCEAGNSDPGDTIQFNWFLNDSLIIGQHSSQVQITAPSFPAQVVIKCRITVHSMIVEDTIILQIVEHIPLPPVVNGIQADLKYTLVNSQNTFTAIVDKAPGDTLTFNWSCSAGVLIANNGNPVKWQAPATSAINTITVKVTNQYTLSTIISLGVLVKDTSTPIQTPLIWYPFDTDDRNAAANRFHATTSGVTKTTDARGLSSLAYRFTDGQNIIFTENNTDLNFTEAVSLSCWFKCELLGSERFIISHGSWQERYKLSITPEGVLRWTVKTSSGVADLDGSAPIELNRYYHVCAMYTGYSMELYLDGVLDTFKAFSGALQISTKPFTIGRMDDLVTLYALRGSVDEVKVWDKEIPMTQIALLKNQWLIPPKKSDSTLIVNIYPTLQNKL